ncbi:MAG: hypothetical protein QGH45_06090 [Myxococcota bacterium]|nr:hypothetical protein [Myxococcota bacterium]
MCFWLGGDSTDPEKWDVDANWLRDSANQKPASGDDLISPAGSPSISDGLAQGGLQLASFVVEEGYAGNIGKETENFVFKMEDDDFRFAGSGLARLEITVVTVGSISPVIARAGRGSAGVPGLQLNCDLLNKVHVEGPGSVYLGVGLGGSSTKRDNLHVTGGARVVVGPDVTDIATTGRPNATVTHRAADVTLECDAQNVEALAGVYRQREGYWVKANVHESTVYTSGSGTHTDTYVDCGGTVINSENNRDRTFTNVEIQRSGSWLDPAGTGTYTTAVEFPTGMDNCSLDFGRKKKLTVANI